MSDKIRTTFYLTSETKDKLRKYAYLINKKHTTIVEEILNKELTRLIDEVESNSK